MLGLLKCSLDRYIETRRKKGGQAAPQDQTRQGASQGRPRSSLGGKGAGAGAGGWGGICEEEGPQP